MAERLKLSRRDAAKVILTGGGSLFVLLYAPRLLCASNAVEENLPEGKSNPTGETGTPQPTQAEAFSARTRTPTPLPERLATLEPTPDWEIPTVETIKEWLANPEFYTNPLGPSGRIILTPQFDDDQYTRLDPLYLSHFESADYQGNSCSEAVIATVLKLYTYFKTGDVPDITIADVINELMDEEFQGYDLIQPNNTTMQDDPFKWALMAMADFGSRSQLYNVVQLTPDWGLDNTHVVPESGWRSLFRALREEVLDNGGFGVARVLKYGIPPGSAGHFIGIGSFRGGGEPLIVDSIGPEIDGERRGNARIATMGAYVERVRPGVPVWADQPGLLWMAGVVPTFLR